MSGGNQWKSGFVKFTGRRLMIEQPDAEGAEFRRLVIERCFRVKEDSLFVAECFRRDLDG